MLFDRVPGIVYHFKCSLISRRRVRFCVEEQRSRINPNEMFYVSMHVYLFSIENH